MNVRLLGGRGQLSADSRVRTMERFCACESKGLAPRGLFIGALWPQENDISADVFDRLPAVISILRAEPACRAVRATRRLTETDSRLLAAEIHSRWPRRPGGPRRTGMQLGVGPRGPCASYGHGI